MDRYLISLFLRIFAICLTSLTGLYIVIDVFANLEEFLGYAKDHGGLLAVLTAYYGARVLTFFDAVCGVLALISSILAIAWLQRTREMTAMMASGIPASRIIRPLVICSVLVAAGAAISRECVIPQYRDVLSRNAQDWLGDREKPVQGRHDHHLGVLISGQHCRAAEREVTQFSLWFHRPVSGLGQRVIAARAYHQPATTDHPAGYRLVEIQVPSGLADGPDVRLGEPGRDDADDTLMPGFDRFHRDGSLTGEPSPILFYTSKTHDWLKPGEVFLPTQVGFEHLAGNAIYLRHGSTWQLIETLRDAGLAYGADLRVMVHARIVQPLLDGCLVFLGLPIVLSRRQKNLWFALGKCFGVVMMYYLVILGCGTLGGSYWISPVTAAWIPVFLFIPAAYAVARFDA